MNNRHLQQQLQLALLQLQSGRADQAETICHDITESFPDDPNAYYLLGVICLDRQHSDDAASYLTTACGLPGCPEDAFLRLTQLPAGTATAEQMLLLLRNGLGIFPKSSQIWFEYGLTLISTDRENLSRGIAALLQARNAGLSTEALYLALALAYEKQRDTDALNATLSDGLKTFPESVKLRIKQAEVFYKSNDWESALRAFNDLKESFPEAGQAHVRRGAFLINLARYYQWAYRHPEANQALTDAEEALTLANRFNGDQLEIDLATGLLTNLRADWTRSETAFRRAAENPAAPVTAPRQLGYCLTYQGKLAKAEPWLHRARQQDPDDSDTNRHYAHIRRWQGHYDDIIIYSDQSSDHDCAFAGRPASHLNDDFRLPMAVMADHDFELHAELSVHDTGARQTLLRPLKDHCFEITREADNTLSLSVGDGGSWRSIERYRLCDQPVGDRLTLILVRAQGRISCRVSTQPAKQFGASNDLLIPGDNLCIGDPEIPGQVIASRFFLKISNYDRSVTRPCRRIDINTIFYGDMFARLMAHTMLPSLMLPDNLPDLMKDYEVVQHIYCTRRELPVLHQVRHLLDKAGIPLRINTSILEQNGDGAARSCLYRAVWDQVETSLAREALVLMAPPDHVFGRGLSKTLRAMKPYDYLVVGHPRVMMETAYRDLRADLARPDVDQFFTNEYLVDLAMHRHPHLVIQTGLNNPSEFWWNSRRDGDIYRTRFKEPPPVAYYPARDMLCVMTGNPYTLPFETIDHDIVDLMHRTGRLKWVDNSQDFFWIEYCKRTRNVPTIYNRYWSPAARMFSETDLNWHLK
ncbi:tetratricopeptide repeat protein [Alphaproteobacteria bacterium HT1-32]|nr:tetratricopeptide repeat protein [Alphaproteobacteria bacterium HT1-32]